MRFALIIAALFCTSAYAQEVQTSACIKPRNKPNAEVGAIYLHGWFNFGGGGTYVNLERNNRRQLQDLVDKLGYAIAVPLAINPQSTRAGVVRTWAGTGRTPHEALDTIKFRAAEACRGNPMGRGLRLIGFSDGGYQARNIALACAARQPEFSVVMMVGARTENGRPTSRRDCAKFVAVRGSEDGSAYGCAGWKKQGNRRVCVRKIPWHIAAPNMMKSIGGGEVLPNYSGGHVLPPNDMIAGVFGTNANAPALAQQPTVNVPTANPRRPPPLVVLQPPPPPRPLSQPTRATGGSASFFIQ